MEKTVKDLKKLTNSGSKYLKSSIYYAYIPVILFLGFKTMNWDNITGKQPMWLFIDAFNYLVNASINLY